MKLDPDIDPMVRGVLDAAALLDTTEFNIFCLAYARWFGHRANNEAVEPHFSAYMLNESVPFWVHHFTRRIVTLAREGHLNPDDYGLTLPGASARMVFTGRLYTILLILVLVILFAVTLGSEHLLIVVKNCYFPPCY